jgi:hypothetical protein
MKLIVIGSLALNFVLLSALAYFSVRKPSAPQVQETPAQVEPATRPVSRPERAQRPVVAEVGDHGQFVWSHVESADFKQYIANLRGIGCPEETIRDLIVAEVNKLFAPRFAALAAETQKVDYWRNRSKSKDPFGAQLRALEAEKKALLHELLGIDADPYAKWANADVNRLREEGRYSFLPAEKEAQVRAIMEKYSAQLDGTKSSREGIMVNDGSSSSSKRLREQRQQELAQVLSPEELKELSLRDSNTADSVRSRFGNVDLAEAEYRTLYDLRKAYEDAQGVVPDASNPEKMRQRSEARQQLEEAYKTALGEDRWNELQRQQDPTWRGLTQLAQQNNIAPSVIEQAWQQQRQAGEQIMRTLEDRSIPREQRDGIVQQLTAEYDRGLQNLLGEQAYQQYKQNNPGFSFSSGAGDTFSFYTPGGPAVAIPAGTAIRSVDISNGRTDVQVRKALP